MTRLSSFKLERVVRIRVLRIQGQKDELFDAVGLRGTQRVLGVWLPIAHRQVHRHRPAAPTQLIAQGLRLRLALRAQRRAAADGGIQPARVRRAQRGDRPCGRLDERLRNGDVVRDEIDEEIIEKRSDVGQRLRPAELRKDDAGQRQPWDFGASTNAAAHSIGVCGKIPCPRLRMWPTGPAASIAANAASATRTGVLSNIAGSTFP